MGEAFWAPRLIFRSVSTTHKKFGDIEDDILEVTTLLVAWSRDGQGTNEVVASMLRTVPH
jgi:hypothetical protein